MTGATEITPAARRLVVYVRVSTKEQARRGAGLAVQEAECRAWAKDNGYRVVRVHADEGVSGTLDAPLRPGLLAALVDVREHRAAGVLVQRVDRLARDLVAQEAFLAEIRKAGGAVLSTSAAERDLLTEDPGDPTRVLVRQFLGALSQYEAAITRMRLAAGRERKRQAGGYVGGRPSLGLRAEAGRLVADAREQSAVVRMLELRRAGYSLREVAGVLSDEGYLTKDGHEHWHPETVRRTIERVDPYGDAMKG